MPYFATSDHCNIYYEERGKGKPLVLIHGWSCNHHYFKKQVPAFAEKYKVVTLDLRGHGNSDRTEFGLTLPRFAKDVKELIDYLGLKDVTLLGWSMGAQVIFEYVKQFGCENLANVVIVDMSAKIMAEADENWPHAVFGKYTRADTLVQLDAIATDWGAVAEAFVPVIFSDGPCRDEIPWVMNETLQNTPHVMISMWVAIMMNDYRKVVETITVPTLITYGTRPSLYSPENSQWLVEHIKNSKAVGFDGGHAHHFQDADNFNKAVMEFIG